MKYKATRDVSEKGWVKGQVIPSLSDADAKRWTDDGSLEPVTEGGEGGEGQHDDVRSPGMRGGPAPTAAPPDPKSSR